MFAFIALVMLVMFGLYLSRGSADPVIAGGLFLSFLACLAPALLLLKPFEDREALQRRRERFQRERAHREEQRSAKSRDEKPRGDDSRSEGPQGEDPEGPPRGRAS